MIVWCQKCETNPIEDWDISVPLTAEYQRPLCTACLWPEWQLPDYSFEQPKRLAPPEININVSGRSYSLAGFQQMQAQINQQRMRSFA